MRCRPGWRPRAGRNKVVGERRRACEQRKKEISGSAAYRNETDRRKRGKMVNGDPALRKAEAEQNAAESRLKEAAMAHPEYKAICDKIKSGATKPNYNDEIVVMSPICDGEISTIYKPRPGKFIGDVERWCSTTWRVPTPRCSITPTR